MWRTDTSLGAINTVADATLIDATGTLRRIQGLPAEGYPLQFLAASLGCTGSNIGQFLSRTLVSARNARSIRALAEHLATAEPEDFGITSLASNRVRIRAEREGWVPLHLWDEATIDDPKAKPNKPQRPAARGAKTAALIEDVGWILQTSRVDLTNANDRRALAERLGINRKQLSYVIEQGGLLTLGKAA